MLTVRAEAMNSLDALDARDAEVADLRMKALKDCQGRRCGSGKLCFKLDPEAETCSCGFKGNVQIRKERDSLQAQLAELIRDRKLFKEALEEQVSGQSDWATEYCAVIIERERNEALQAQVAKAREALDKIANDSSNHDVDWSAADVFEWFQETARAALATLDCGEK